jgi:thioredoxin-related protein
MAFLSSMADKQYRENLIAISIILTDNSTIFEKNIFMKQGFLIFILVCISLSGFAQVDSTTPPYKKFPVLPPIQILLGDSTTKYTKENLPKKKPVLIMLFSPDCSHCQHEAEQMVLHKNDLKNIQLVMITLNPLWQMNGFVGKYRLKELKNLVVGKDIYYTMPGFYDIRNLPFFALYDKEGNLISVFEGTMDITKVLEAFKAK